MEKEYTSEDLIPSGFRHLYKKSGDKFVLLSASDVKTPEDVANVQEGLRKEREDHKDTKAKLAKFDGLDADEVHTKLDRFGELEAAAKDKIDDKKIDEMVETRLKTRTAPLERKITQLESEAADKDSKIGSFEQKDRQRTIHDHIRTAASAAKLRDTAIEDALVIGERIFDVSEDGVVTTKEGVGVTPGVSPDVWFTEVKDKRPHWWPESKGAGSHGGGGGAGGGSNPFSNADWNLTEQGKIVTEDRSRAEQLAKSAGTTIGGLKPAPTK